MKLDLLIAKIWLYLGTFYFTLIVCLLFSFFRNNRKKILTLFLLISFYFSSRIYFSNFSSLNTDLNNFLLGKDEKINLISSGQYTFLNSIKNFFPEDKKICYPWSSDIAGRYARQFFYPKDILLGAEKLDKCDFLVLDYTFGKKKYELENQLDKNNILLYSTKLGKVFKIVK